ncbi:hypothetical protein BUALT_Bualt14G0122100 [Buddleja alternifolia]|uniref:JAB1/MPN/MOV34 metalloenzyme domain-containing protein n=1 Tax=Buddleja alternifolia TaxID=168488 RepID=A0AAV6WRN4_9LAMI|nr:hypothetical protein BUALT_Bualt14G0122100 [Buddleja alternifolia]
MRRPAHSSSSINFSAMTRKIDVDNRISLRNCYRIADNLLKQANIYREEKNLIDLYVILLRYSRLCLKERAFFKKKLLAVIDELENLKPQVPLQLDELDKMSQAITAPSSSLKPNNQYARVSSSNSVDSQFQKLSLGLPLPKQETLSWHSLLGPSDLLGQWLRSSAEIKVNYPTNIVVDSSEIPSLNQVGQHDPLAIEDSAPKVEKSTMDSVLSLDDGRWFAEESNLQQVNELENNDFQLGIIRQPSPPPVLAQVQPELLPISPSRVADQRPGPPKLSQDGLPSSISYQDLHIPVKMMEDFLRLARENTRKNLETCGVLAGSLRNRVFHITALIIPKQESTSDSVLHTPKFISESTHPTQTCFMSSVDLHTHYSYQIMLPEAIAIVMAPTDTSSPHGIFHLSDPGGVSVIMQKCQQRGFHPHEEPEDGSPIYEHCSHVYMNSKLQFDVIDLRCV